MSELSAFLASGVGRQPHAVLTRRYAGSHAPDWGLPLLPRRWDSGAVGETGWGSWDPMIAAASVETCPDAFVAVDPSFRVVAWNRAAEQLLGWRAAEVLGAAPPHLPEDAAATLRGEVARGERRLLLRGKSMPLFAPPRDELWRLLANKFVHDTDPPVGGVRLLPTTTDAQAVRVSWRAIDYASGVSHYNVQARAVGDAWQPWFSGTTRTSAWFTGRAGTTYEFRVRAYDLKGNGKWN